MFSWYNNWKNALPKACYTAKQVKELDQLTITDHGISGLELMQRAGKAAFNELTKQWPQVKNILVVCGQGNNAGDGYVLARVAIEAGKKVQVIQLGGLERQTSEAKECMYDLMRLRPNITAYSMGKLATAITSSDLIVDAIFGTGLNRDVYGDWYEAIELIHDSDRPIFSLDIPSGLNADTGSAYKIAVKADLTINFIGLKRGLLTGDGLDYSGKIVFDNLSVPDEIYEQVPSNVKLLHYTNFCHLLSPRKLNSHKGLYGHALLIGGAPGYGGAIIMAAEATARTGAGLTSVATTQMTMLSLNQACPEVMSHAVSDTNEINHLLTQVTVIGIGPGLGTGTWGKNLFSRILEWEGKKVLDADALNLLANEPVKCDSWILTPHPGEAARLLNCTTKDIQSDRFGAIKELQQQYGGAVILKGAGSLVANEEEIGIVAHGNPGMASGGMGDTLTGILTGLLAQNLSLTDAAQLGACLHAKAGDIAAKDGERGILARDVIAEIRPLMNPN